MVLHYAGKSSYEISRVLKKRNLVLSPTGVRKLIARNSGRKKAPAKRAKRLSNPGSPKVRTKSLIRKVKADFKGANPLPQRRIAERHNVSLTTISRIKMIDLHGILRKKYRVHALSNAQIAQRLQRGPLFLRYLEGQKFKKIITVDECWIYLTSVRGVRRIYYEFKGEKVGINFGRCDIHRGLCVS